MNRNNSPRFLFLLSCILILPITTLACRMTLPRLDDESPWSTQETVFATVSETLRPSFTQTTEPVKDALTLTPSETLPPLETPTPTQQLMPQQPPSSDPDLTISAAFTADEAFHEIRSVKPAGDGQHLIIQYFGGEFTLWNWQADTHENYRFEQAFLDIDLQSYFGSTVLAGYLSEAPGTLEVLIYNAGQPTPSETYRITTTEQWVTAVALSPDTSLLGVGYNDGIIKIIETRTGYEVHALEVFNDWPMLIAFSPNSRYVLIDSFSFDPHTYVIDAQNGVIIATLNEEDYDPGLGFFSWDGSYLVWTNHFETWVFDTGSWGALSHLAEIAPYGLSPDNTVLFVWNDTGGTSLFNAGNGQWLADHPAETLHVLPDGRLVNLIYEQGGNSLLMESVRLDLP
jgi:WD40 repeat protein